MNIHLPEIIIAVCMAAAVSAGSAAPAGEAKLHKYSTTIEKERPQLDEETKRLISACRRDPSETNRAALRKQIAVNYDKVVARKKAKLEELKRTARHASKVQEMQEIVDEMLLNREKRIEQSMRRFTRSAPPARFTQYRRRISAGARGRPERVDRPHAGNLRGLFRVRESDGKKTPERVEERSHAGRPRTASRGECLL